MPTRDGAGNGASETGQPSPRVRRIRHQPDRLPLCAQTLGGERRDCRLAGSADKQPEELGLRSLLSLLRNVKGFRWNHKRVYRSYRELELNLRIKPKKRLIRETPQPLAVPEQINKAWSMDFMHDQLADRSGYST